MRPRNATGGGIRRLYREDLSPERFTYPRKTLPHGVTFYTDGHLAKRPLFAFHSYARFAEYLLYCAKYGKRERARERVKVVTEFFAETRRLEQNVLSTYRLDEEIPSGALAKMRADVLVLAGMAETAYVAVGRKVSRCQCPACKGRVLLVEDADLLEQLLAEASVAGRIPETSPFYRKPPLTSSKGL